MKKKYYYIILGIMVLFFVAVFSTDLIVFCLINYFLFRYEVVNEGIRFVKE